MHGEKIGEEERQVLDKFLVGAVAVGIGSLEVHGQRNDVGDGCECFTVHLSQLFVVPRLRVQTSNLRQALQSDVPERRNFKKAASKGFNKTGARRRGLKYVSQGYPVQEA